MKSLYALLFCALCAICTASADQTKTILPKPFCQTSEYRQFDFWIGNWASFDEKGVLQGYTKVDRILGGCALQEYWHGTDGSTGTSFSIYDQNRKVWNQTWVSGRGTLLSIEGGLVGTSIILTGNHVNSTGAVELHRTIWTPLADGAVRQVWDYTTDGGQSWTVNYVGSLRRTANAVE